MWVHLVARTRPPQRPLCQPEHAPHLWRSLRRTFPRVLGAVLMPNHVHVLACVADPEAARRSLSVACGNFVRRIGRTGLWEPVPAGTAVHAAGIARRTVRYVALNPCRAGLVDDPLQWPWSTHRDVVGAIAEPWVEAEELAESLGSRPREIHAYVARDESAASGAERWPCPAGARRLAGLSLAELARAAAAATRSSPRHVQHRGPTRHLFVLLAKRVARWPTSMLAEACAVTPRAIQSLSRRAAPELLSAGLTCAGDERLRAWRVPAGARSR